MYDVQTLLTIQAKNNQFDNLQLLKIAQTLSDESLREDRGSYFTSIWGLLNHMPGSNLRILNILSNVFPDHPSCQHPHLKKTFERGEDLAPNLEELSQLTREIDQLYVDLIEDLKGDWDKSCTVEMGGDTLTQTASFYLLQIINHQIHHRGQISQIYDSMGIEHDLMGIRSVIHRLEGWGF